MEYSVQCIQCEKEFKASRSTAKFCCSTCRSNYRHDKGRKKDSQNKKFAKEKIAAKDLPKASEEKEEVRPGFVPNWKRIGLKNKEEGYLVAIGSLMQKARVLRKLGMTPDVYVVWRNKMIKL